MLFDGLTLPTILIAVGAMAVGCAFQAAVGLGFALVAAPALALAAPSRPLQLAPAGPASPAVPAAPWARLVRWPRRRRRTTWCWTAAAMPC